MPNTIRRDLFMSEAYGRKIDCLLPSKGQDREDDVLSCLIPSEALRQLLMQSDSSNLSLPKLLVRGKFAMFLKRIPSVLMMLSLGSKRPVVQITAAKGWLENEMLGIPRTFFVSEVSRKWHSK